MKTLSFKAPSVFALLPHHTAFLSLLLFLPPDTTLSAIHFLCPTDTLGPPFLPVRDEWIKGVRLLENTLFSLIPIFPFPNSF